MKGHGGRGGKGEGGGKKGGGGGRKGEVGERILLSHI